MSLFSRDPSLLGVVGRMHFASILKQSLWKPEYLVAAIMVTTNDVLEAANLSLVLQARYLVHDL